MNHPHPTAAQLRRAALEAMRREVASAPIPEDEPGIPEALAVIEAGEAEQETGVQRRMAVALALIGLGQVDEAVPHLNAEFEAAEDRRQKRREAQDRKARREAALQAAEEEEGLDDQDLDLGPDLEDAGGEATGRRSTASKAGPGAKAPRDEESTPSGKRKTKAAPRKGAKAPAGPVPAKAPARKTAKAAPPAAAEKAPARKKPAKATNADRKGSKA